VARAPFQVLVYPYRSRAELLEFAIFRRADKGYWQTVAGGGEGRETPLQAARRELWEETGIQTAESALLQLQTVEPVPVTEFKASPIWGEELYVIPQYCFGVDVGAAEIRLSAEHSELAWLTYPAALARIHHEGNRTALWELAARLHGKGPRGFN